MNLMYVAVICALIGLVFAFVLTKRVNSVDAGTDRMKEIASAIAEGARAFLFAEYRILAIFIVVLFVVLCFLRNPLTAVCFLCGAVLSIIAGYCGMTVATKANVRTANAARTSGMNKALNVAFSGGAVMGMCVAGLGLLGVAGLYVITGDADVLFGFSLGASSIALFARVGGGIYTKAADVGADLVGKVEAGIPEDDPRNPATIADNVGDNVGDVAGMGADLFESYAGSLISAITLGLAGSFGAITLDTAKAAIFPAILSALGIVASVIGTFMVQGKEGGNPQKALNRGEYTADAIVVIGAIALSVYYLGSIMPAVAIIAGLIVGLIIGIITEVYTSGDYGSVKKIAEQSETGAATTIISGLAVGMQSTAIPLVLICVGIFVAYKCCGLYGIALAAVGMLSTTGITVAVDAYGPIAEMSYLDESVREITDSLDAVGNTTAAMGKGFAIGSAALTAMALFMSYAQQVNLSAINILSYTTIIGLLIGGMLPFLFSAFTMESVSKAAYSMIEEVRRQFREIPGIMEGKSKPDYTKCVDISTKAALREMIIPGVMAVVAPIIIGFLLGTEAVGGMLAGSLVTGVMMAIFMSNAGGAWDNAKKYIENGNHGGKGSEAHKAAVVGDTVGDPFKDTSGPAINILIKLMTIVALVFSSVFIGILN